MEHIVELVAGLASRYCICHVIAMARAPYHAHKYNRHFLFVETAFANFSHLFVWCFSDSCPSSLGYANSSKIHSHRRRAHTCLGNHCLALYSVQSHFHSCPFSVGLRKLPRHGEMCLWTIERRAESWRSCDVMDLETPSLELHMMTWKPLHQNHTRWPGNHFTGIIHYDLETTSPKP